MSRIDSSGERFVPPRVGIHLETVSAVPDTVTSESSYTDNSQNEAELVKELSGKLQEARREKREVILHGHPHNQRD